MDGPERKRMVLHNSAGLVIHNNMALQPTTADCTSFDQGHYWLLVLEHLRHCKGDSQDFPVDHNTAHLVGVGHA